MATESAGDERRAGDRAAAILAAAEALEPEIRARALELERGRRLPADLARRFAEAGFFRTAVPAAFGGAELDPLGIVRLVETVARADGSSGWCVMIGATTALLSGILPEATGRKIYGADPNVITGGTSAPFGKAREVEGGHRVTGRWPWGSGAQTASGSSARAWSSTGTRRECGPAPAPRCGSCSFRSPTCACSTTGTPRASAARAVTTGKRATRSCRSSISWRCRWDRQASTAHSTTRRSSACSAPAWPPSRTASPGARSTSSSRSRARRS